MAHPSDNLRIARTAIQALSREEALELVADLDRQAGHYAVVCIDANWVAEAAHRLGLTVGEIEVEAVLESLREFDWSAINQIARRIVEEETREVVLN